MKIGARVCAIIGKLITLIAALLTIKGGNFFWSAVAIVVTALSWGMTSYAEGRADEETQRKNYCDEENH